MAENISLFDDAQTKALNDLVKSFQGLSTGMVDLGKNFKSAANGVGNFQKKLSLAEAALFGFSSRIGKIDLGRVLGTVKFSAQGFSMLPGSFMHSMKHGYGIKNSLSDLKSDWKTALQGLGLFDNFYKATGASSKLTGGMKFSTGPAGNAMAAILGSVGIWVSAIGLAATAALAFVSTMKSNITGLVTSGARMGQGGALHSLAAAFGMSGGELGGKARSFGELISGGGIPGSIAAQMGIHPFGGLGGDQNYLDKFTTALRDILNDPNDQRANMKARFLGLEDFAWLRQADKSHQNMALSGYGMDMGPARMTEAANGMVEFNRAMQEFMDAVRGFGAAVLPTLTLAIKHWMGIAIAALAGFIAFGPLGALAGAGLMLGADALIYGNDKGEKGKVVSNNTEAIKANTEAVRENTIMVTGTYGGGSVFGSNVIPRGWGSMTLNDKARGMSMALGAFSI